MLVVYRWLCLDDSMFLWSLCSAAVFGEFNVETPHLQHLPKQITLGTFNFTTETRSGELMNTFKSNLMGE